MLSFNQFSYHSVPARSAFGAGEDGHEQNSWMGSGERVQGEQRRGPWPREMPGEKEGDPQRLRGRRQLNCALRKKRKPARWWRVALQAWEQPGKTRGEVGGLQYDARRAGALSHY